MIALLEAHRAGLYARAQWVPNIVAGVSVGVVALLLAMAFAMASGALVSVNNVNARRGGENDRIAQWEDKVWLSFDPSSAIVLTE